MIALSGLCQKLDEKSPNKLRVDINLSRSLRRVADDTFKDLDRGLLIPKGFETYLDPENKKIVSPVHLIEPANLSLEAISGVKPIPSILYGKDGKGIISKLIEEQTPVITSPQHYTRDFIHALDICNAIIKSLKYRKNNVFNISSSKAISIGVLPIKIGKTIKNSIKHKREIKFSCLNNTKAKKELKWTPKISLEKGIKEYELL